MTLTFPELTPSMQKNIERQVGEHQLELNERAIEPFLRVAARETGSSGRLSWAEATTAVERYAASRAAPRDLSAFETQALKASVAAGIRSGIAERFYPTDSKYLFNSPAWRPAFNLTVDDQEYEVGQFPRSELHGILYARRVPAGESEHILGVPTSQFLQWAVNSSLSWDVIEDLPDISDPSRTMPLSLYTDNGPRTYLLVKEHVNELYAVEASPQPGERPKVYYLPQTDTL